MKHSYKEQITAIADARRFIKFASDDVNERTLQSVDERLNDAASTIASIRLNPDIFEKVSALESKVKTLTHEIEQLILNAEEDTLNYSVLEHARKLIFEAK